LNTFNLFTILTHEYIGIAKDTTQKGLTLFQRFCYIFAPPGWSHDGSRLSTADIKRAAGIGTKAGDPVAAETNAQ
jgi:hypothetical protein